MHLLIRTMTAAALSALMLFAFCRTAAAAPDAPSVALIASHSHTWPDRGSDAPELRRRHRRSVESKSAAADRIDRDRRISRRLLREQLPEVARLLELDTDDDTAADDAAASVDATVTADFSDSELSDDEEAATDDDQQGDDASQVYEDFTRYMSRLNDDSYLTDNGIDRQQMIETIWDWIGTRYHFGGTSRSGIDCSAFTGTVYRAIGHRLPRTAAAQWDAGDEVGEDQMQFGDLVFFHTRRAVYVSHVGIYLGNHLFAHASSRNGVIVSSLESDYYSTHFIGARRFEVAAPVADVPNASEGM